MKIKLESRGKDGVIPLYLLDRSKNKSNRLKNFDGPMNWHSPKNTDDSLHKAMRPVIILARCFALFPIVGISANNASGLQKYVTVQLKNFYISVDFVFLASLTCIYLLFMQLARKWSHFASEWEQAEKHCRMLGCSTNLKNKFKFLIFTIMLLALIEHISSIATKVVDALPCTKADTDIIKAYFVNSYKHIFTFIDYNLLIAFGVAIITLIMSCAWNFMDVFIIIMSVAMADRYRQFNRLLQSVNKKDMPVTFWRNMRETFNQLSYLTKMLDELLSPIVLLSFANNLYFICLQLLNSLKPMASTWHATYFVYSFSYLVLRTITVSLYAAAVYDQSKQPKSVLFSVPSESYCTEVARLLNQVASDDLALTGCRFFSVTRTLVLTVAGTIVTYEIVLVQFSAVSGDTKKNTTITCI
ncbi:hypothetical protein PGB90_001290 [Kerria lacca]